MCSSDLIEKLTIALEHLQQDAISSAKLSETHPELAEAIRPFCGILAISIDISHRGWVVWLRAEQIDNVRWAGKPEKVIKSGINGPRLSPRGSFLEWREEVRGSSTPWDTAEIETAAALRSELNRIAGAHAIEMERVRVELLAALGHDLRGPLQFISTAAQIMQRSYKDELNLGARIQASSGRMSRLVMQILDMSRLQSNSGITLNQERFDLVHMLREIASETALTDPGIQVDIEAPESLITFADRDRLAQVISNLLSNARVHGAPNNPIRMFAEYRGDSIHFGVINQGDPIPADQRNDLFRAFKRGIRRDHRNHSGLGLGLYIASEIVVAHGGTLSVECEGGLTVFTAKIDAVRPEVTGLS